MSEPHYGMNPGDVYKTTNGNLYLVLPNRLEAYIGNYDPRRTHLPDVAPLEPTTGSEVVTSLKSYPWTND